MLKNCNRNRVYLNIIIALAILYYMPLILSAPPVTTVQQLNAGMTISYPTTSFIKQGENLAVRFWVYNVTNGNILTNVTTNCTFNLLNSTGHNIIRLTSPASSGIKFGNLGVNACQNCFNFEINSKNFTYLGYYTYQIRCISGVTGSYNIGYYEVTPNGLEKPEQNTLIFFVILSLIILCLTTYITIYSIGHLTSMDFDILDLAINWSMFFFIAGFYYFERIHFQDIFIGKFMDIFLYPAGIFLILIPIIAFIISTFIGTLNKKMYRQRVPKRLIGGRRNEKEI